MNLKLPMTLLSGVCQDFGVQENYTHASSEFDYILQSKDGVPTLTTMNNRIGLLENARSATRYYEIEVFSIYTPPTQLPVELLT